MPPPSRCRHATQGYLPRDLYNRGQQVRLPWAETVRNMHLLLIHENNLKAIADIVILPALSFRGISSNTVCVRTLEGRCKC